MFKNVVVGVDRRSGGADAIALSQRLLASDGELTLAHVFPGEGQAWREAPSDAELREREDVMEMLEAVRDAAGVDANLRWRESSSAGRGLHELCELVEADLLVVGSSRRGLLGRVVLGDDTRAALNGAPCAIAIAPAGYSGRRAEIREIGVGYNESAESQRALDLARELADTLGAKLSAFEAISVPSYAFLGGPAISQDAVEELVDQARQRISDLGAVEPHAAYGDAAEELSLYSASLDLLIVGSRAYGPVGRLMHGSTTHQLARNARCPLLVLTRSERRPR